MRFGGGTEPGDPSSESGNAALPVDFMHDPGWAALVGPVLRREVDPRTLGRLPRRDRDYVYRVVAHFESPVTVSSAQRWYRDAPSAVTAGLVGAAKVRDAKRIRQGRRLPELTPEETDRYSVILADAESFLLNACTHDPDALLPWIARIDLARGLRLGHDEILRRFAEAQSRERWNLLAAEAAFTGLLPVWSGSYALVFDFAAKAVADTGPGHPVRSLVALAEADRLMRDPNLALHLIPAREGLDLGKLFAHYVRALPEELDPDDVVGLGAFLFVATPRNRDEATTVMLALESLRGRCGGLPYSELNDPAAWFTRTLEARQKEARALLADW